MRRLACVDVPALPLQMVLRRRPEWRGRPVAVLLDDRVRWANRHALSRGVRPGMRPAQADAACPGLCFGEALRPEIEREVLFLAALLQKWSPRVESAASLGAFLGEFGVDGSFWLRADGLSSLFGDATSWAKAMRKDLAGVGFRASVVVGFTRFGAWAAARSRFGMNVFDRPEEETDAARRAPLIRFGLPTKKLDTLETLAIRHLDDLLKLPGKGLEARFGSEVRRLHRLASGEIDARVDRVFSPVKPIERRLDFDPPETDGERLLFHAKRMLDGLLADLASKGIALARLDYRLKREDGSTVSGSVAPPFPSRDGVRVLRLLQLQFLGRRPAGETDLGNSVATLVLTATGGAEIVEQRGLFDASDGGRDGATAGMAHEALARVQAEFGEESLLRIRLRDAHLPSKQFACEPVSPRRALMAPRSVMKSAPQRTSKTETSKPGASEGSTDRSEDARTGKRPMVRRIFDRPLAFPGPKRPVPKGLLAAPDGWPHPLGAEAPGPIQAMMGPYRLSGGWWGRLSGRPVCRDYYFLRTRRGDVYWSFFDRRKKAWFLEGRLE